MDCRSLTNQQGRGFSGSYDRADVTFLLKPISMLPTPVEEKERLIQSGRHYSEMIAPERLPDPRYLELYRSALARNGARLAADVAALAGRLREEADGREIVLASLARAGTPIGVLLRRVLAAWAIPVTHYSLSIIRGRGIDRVALAHVAARHDPRDVIFVDGWTGKGAISRELESSLKDRPFGFAPRLAVIADPAGRADVSATGEDYLIASGLLNAIVSGLVSRSILSRDTVAAGDFHACVHHREWAPHDLSRSFVDALTPLALEAEPRSLEDDADARRELRTRCEELMTRIASRAAVDDPNRIKPGIAEATRALLRRVPERLFLREQDDPDVAHIVHLARAADVPIEALDRESAYRAVAVIARRGEE